MLAVATDPAERIIGRAQRINLTREAFRRFVSALDAPAEEMPTLRRYALERGPIPAR